MKFVALLSGGKDSCFNLLESVANGHEPVAVGGLVPEQGIDELDSFMFQTVGLSLLPLIAQSLRLPLYTRTITGKPLNVESEYGDRRGLADRDDGASSRLDGTLGDETEDLFALLSDIKSHHPDVQAVAVGAILSSYQRVRVEHVCSRLGLTSLAFLWQRPQPSLLSSMISSNLTAVLVKVAGIGLTKDHLGKTLGAMQPTLTKLNAMYGLHVCGEGGEYETVTLDCPLFHERIELSEVRTVVVDASPVAPVAHLQIISANLVPKPDYIAPSVADLKTLLAHDDSSCLDEEAQDIAVCISSLSSDSTNLVESRQTGSSARVAEPASSVEVDVPTSCRRGGWLAIGIERGDRSESGSLEDEVRSCFVELKASLAQNDADLSKVTFITLLISSMDLFPAVNAVYKTYFGSSPPARACVAASLPRGRRLTLEAIAYDGSRSKDRHALHVQGLSYWAPANIGPYSQAVISGERVFLAGQIPLIPSTLSLPTPSSFPVEASLSLKHVRSIVLALREGTGGGWDSGFVEGCICWVPRWDSDLEGARCAWDASLTKESESSSLPQSTNLPPTLYVSPPSLPKDALVEWQVSLHTGRTLQPPVGVDDDDEEEQPTPRPKTTSWRWEGHAESQSQEYDEGAASWGVAAFRSLDHLRTLPSEHRQILCLELENAFSLKVFYTPAIDSIEVSAGLRALVGGGRNFPALTLVPVNGVATQMGEWNVGLAWIGSRLP